MTVAGSPDTVLVREIVRPPWTFRLGPPSMDGLLRRRADGLVRLVHAGSEPVVVAVAQTSPERVVFAARAATDEAARAGIARMRFATGVDDDLAPFHARFRDDPVIGRAIRARPGLRVRRNPDPWETLAWAITEQLIDFERATLIQKRLIRALGPRCAHTGLRDAPGAATIAAQAPAQLERCGLAAKRARAMRRAAAAVASGRIDLSAPGVPGAAGGSGAAPVPGAQGAVGAPGDLAGAPVPGAQGAVGAPGDLAGAPVPGAQGAVGAPGDLAGAPVPGAQGAVGAPGDLAGAPVPGAQGAVGAPGDLAGAPPAPAAGDLTAAPYRRLLAISEIGPWTVEMLALHGQARLDVVPAGDLGYLRLVGQVATGNPRAFADEAEVRGFFSAYAPWAGLAGEYLRLAGAAGSLGFPRPAAVRPRARRSPAPRPAPAG